MYLDLVLHLQIIIIQHLNKMKFKLYIILISISILLINIVSYSQSFTFNDPTFLKSPIISGGGGGGSFDATNLTNLKLWLNTDSLSGSSDGDRITTWTDSSLVGNNVSNGGGTVRPTYKVNQINSRPALFVDGTLNQYLQSSSFSSIGEPWTVYLVTIQSATYGNMTIFDGLSDTIRLKISAASSSGNLNASTPTVALTSTGTAILWTIVSVRFDGVNSIIFTNGVSAASGDLTEPTFTGGLSGFTIGNLENNGSPPGGTGWYGYIAEVIAQSSWNSTEHSNMVYTLKQRFGL